MSGQSGLLYARNTCSSGYCLLCVKENCTVTSVTFNSRASPDGPLDLNFVTV